jgi:tRNA(fMet)-specific endonuclease VapC
LGTLLDSTVFIHFERSLRGRDPVSARRDALGQLRDQLGEYEEVAISAITASQLLHGVHRADPTNQVAREAFVEMVIDTIPVIPFDLLTARTHARLWADLAAHGIDIGPHDRIVAATAMAMGWRLGTANVRHFNRISGLTLAEINLGTPA